MRMSRNKKERWLKYSTNGLLLAYFLMMICFFAYSAANDLHEYENTGEYGVEQPDLGRISLIYYGYYAFNVACVMGILWFDPDKKKKIEQLEKKILEAIK